MGIDSLFIGNLQMKDPVLLILQEDNKSLILESLDKSLEDKLPRGVIKLFSKVKSIHWTPFRDGLCVLYEGLNES